MSQSEELGYVRKGFSICREELSEARFEIRRLRCLIARATVDLEESGAPDMAEWLDNEARQLTQCQCGKLWCHDELAWRDWSDVGLQIAECIICSSTVSRTYVK